MRIRHFILFLVAVSALCWGCNKIDVQADNQGGDEEKLSKAEKADFVFDEDDLPRLSIEVSLEEWNRLLHEYDKDNQTKEYVMCDVTLIKDHQRYVVKESGLRLRGQTSRRRPEGWEGSDHIAGGTSWHHSHLGINFRKYHKGDKAYDINGVHRINLKYAHEDPTYVREMYCYDLLRRFGVWTASRASYCKLYIHVKGDSEPAYLGVYVMIESVDDEFIETREKEFGGRDGFLWKCAWGANLRDTDDWRFRYDDNGTDARAYELKTNIEKFDIAKDQITDFIDNLNKLKGAAFENWIRQVCDVDLLLRTYAAFVALGHWDDYWNDMNNFYLYFNSTDASSYKMYMLPYDLDNTLGTSHNCGVQNDSGRHDPYNWGLDECVLIKKILSVSEFKTLYTSYLKELASPDNDLFNYDASIKRITAWQDMIEPYLENDTGEDMVIKDRPASWGNHYEYRIMEDGVNNWFRVKCEVLNSL